jgi:hypothetical protein
MLLPLLILILLILQSKCNEIVISYKPLITASIESHTKPT